VSTRRGRKAELRQRRLEDSILFRWKWERAFRRLARAALAAGVSTREFGAAVARIKWEDD